MTRVTPEANIGHRREGALAMSKQPTPDRDEVSTTNRSSNDRDDPFNLPAVLLGICIAALLALAALLEEPFSPRVIASWFTLIGLAYLAVIGIAIVATVKFAQAGTPAGYALAVVCFVILGATALSWDWPTARVEAQEERRRQAIPELIAFQYAPGGVAPGIYLVDPSIQLQSCNDITRVTPHGIIAAQPSWLAGRAGLVYSRLKDDGRWTLQIQEFDWRDGAPFPQHRRELPAAEGYHAVNPTASPTSAWIAYVRLPVEQKGESVTQAGQLWLHDLAAGDARMLLEDPVAHPRWSSDGTKLVFTRQVDIEGERRVRVEYFELDEAGALLTGPLPLLVAGEELMSAAAVDLHEGGSLSYTAGPPGGPNSIYFTSDLTSKAASPAIEFGESADDYHDSQPTMDSAGQRVAFVSTRESRDHDNWHQQLWWADFREGVFGGFSPLTDISRCQGAVQAPAW